MKKTFFKSMMYLSFALIFTVGCKKAILRNDTTNVPNIFMDRATEIQDKVNLSSRNVKFSVWDHGQIDGDIISVYVNGNRVLNEFTLTGSKHTFDVTLDFNGYNYVLMYAHNEGTISPNTASLEITDGDGSHEVSLESDLTTSGVAELIVN